MGDVNIHLDNATDAATVSFALLLSSYKPYTSRAVADASHICWTSSSCESAQRRRTSTCRRQAAGLSDHSMIDVALDLRYLNQFESTSVRRRAWRSFNYDDFCSDLRHSTLLGSSASDVDELVAAYDNVLPSLLDVHAPNRIVRQSMRPSQHWYDAECSAMRRKTRVLERVYRRCGSADNLTDWKSQFSAQRCLFQQKASDY